MKYILLLATTTSAFTYLGEAQVTLPHNVMQHQQEMTAMVQEYLQLLNEPSKSFFADEFETQAVKYVLDSTITYDVFDVGGGNHLLMLASREDYLYPEPRVQIVTGSDYDSGAWSKSYRSRLWYDDLGRLIVDLSEIYNTAFDLWESDSRFRVYPYANSFTLIDSLLVEAWSVELNNWERQLTVRNTIDAGGILHESESTLMLLGIPVVFREIYYYDASGYNTEIETFLVTEDLEIPAGREEREYNLGLLYASTSFVYNESGEAVPTEKTIYTYNFLSYLPETVRTYLWDEVKEDWLMSHEVITSYDELWRQSTVESTDNTQEGQQERTKAHFQYLDGPYVSRIDYEMYDYANEMYLPSSSKAYFYSEVISALRPDPQFAPFAVIPNPTSGPVDVTLEAPGTMEVYNISGQKMAGQRVGAGINTFDLSDWPAGVYPVVIRNAGQVIFSKIVKH